MDALLQADTWLFHFINHTLANPLFDALLPWCRERWVWAPLYVFALAFIWLNLGRRRGWWVVLGLAVAVAVADTASSELIKKRVQRLRPCNDPALSQRVHLRIESCGSGYSFTSSHAANHFAVAVFLIGVFGSWQRRLKPALLGWAGLIALSQGYVGVLFPADVVAGALLGSAIGWAVAQMWRRGTVWDIQAQA
ncbi:MAG TPA: phosphatase PAP2 family protein [Saprospiraceae bacterium]|nr:phosphatase PAP2 family protein [Saprospiraceae bacterium]